MDFLTSFGINASELWSLLIMLAAAVVLFMVMRFVLKVTRTVLRMGCLFVGLIVGGAVILFLLT